MDLEKRINEYKDILSSNRYLRIHKIENIYSFDTNGFFYAQIKTPIVRAEDFFSCLHLSGKSLEEKLLTCINLLKGNKVDLQGEEYAIISRENKNYNGPEPSDKIHYKLRDAIKDYMSSNAIAGYDEFIKAVISHPLFSDKSQEIRHCRENGASAASSDDIFKFIEMNPLFKQSGVK